MLLIFRKKLLCILLEGRGGDGSLISHFSDFIYVKGEYFLNERSAIGKLIRILGGEYLLGAIHSKCCGQAWMSQSLMSKTGFKMERQLCHGNTTLEGNIIFFL